MMVNLTDNLDQAYSEKLVKPFEDKTGLKVKIEGPPAGARGLPPAAGRRHRARRHPVDLP